MNVLSEWNSFACRGLNVLETRWYEQQIFISHWKPGKPTNQGRPTMWFADGGLVSSGSREQRTSFLTTVLVKALIPPVRAPPSRPSRLLEVPPPHTAVTALLMLRAHCSGLRFPRVLCVLWLSQPLTRMTS